MQRIIEPRAKVIAPEWEKPGWAATITNDVIFGRKTVIVWLDRRWRVQVLAREIIKLQQSGCVVRIEAKFGQSDDSPPEHRNEIGRYLVVKPSGLNGGRRCSW